MRARLRLLLLIFFASGVAGLGYQMAWTRMFAVGLGHEIPSVLAVVAAFFGGLALGAWLLDRPLARTSQPGRWYAVLEIVIGVWGFVAIPLIPIANDLALRMIGVDPTPLRHWFVAFAIPFVVLLPATTAMGATMPAMERFVSPLVESGRCIGALYAANTGGAVIGTLAGAFVLAPQLGYRLTIVVLASVNLIIGGATWLLASKGAPSKPQPYDPPVDPIASRRLAVTVFVTGLLGIAYEVLAVRVMSQVLENTVYSYASALAVYLLGTALGAAVYQRLGRRFAYRPLLGHLLCGIALSCLIGTWMLFVIGPLYHRARAALPDTLAGVFVVEITTAALIFALPTFVMGATFSHIVQAARQRDGGVGRAFAINTLGGALASPLAAVMLLPLVGAKVILTLVSLAYLACIPPRAKVRWAIILVPIVLPVLMPQQLQIVTIEPDSKLLTYREGVMASVSVVEQVDGGRNLRINNRFRMGGTGPGAIVPQRLQAHVPLLLHERPATTLFLGVASGMTLGTVIAHPGLEADGVELIPEVLDVLPLFEPYNVSPYRQPRINLYAADARRFVRATRRRYDVIIADLFQPARDGAGMLYTTEHFQAVRSRLNSGGLFCQWLPLYQMDEPVLQTVIRTFLEVFPDSSAFLAHDSVRYPALGLIGRTAPGPKFATGSLEQRVTDERLRIELDALMMSSEVQLLGRFLAGAEQLRAFAGPGAKNSDDHPIVMFEAPRFSYDTSATSHGRLMTMLDQVSHAPDELITLSDDGDLRDRVADYVTARRVYLDGLIAVDTNPPEAFERYLESARLSRDFDAGFKRGLAQARGLMESDPETAGVLARRLAEVRPGREEPREILRELGSE